MATMQDEPAKKRVRTEAAPAEDDTSKSKVFIRNLPPDTTSASLEKTFGEFGPLKRCFVVTEKGTGKCNGTAFVQFAVDADAQRAVDTANGSKVGSRRVIVSLAKRRKRDTEFLEKLKTRRSKEAKKEEDREMRATALGARKLMPQKNAPSGAAPMDEDEDDDDEFDLEQQGFSEKAKRSIANTARATGVAKQTPKCVRLACRSVIVKNVSSEAVRDGVVKLAGDAGMLRDDESDLEPRNLGIRLALRSPAEAQVVADAINGKTVEGVVVTARVQRKEFAEGSRLIVRNMPFKWGEKALRAKFGKYGEILEVVIPLNHGRPKGFAFVQFADKADAKKAMKAIDGTPSFKGTVSVTVAVSKEVYETKGQTKDEEAEEEEHKDEDDNSDDDSDEEKPRKKRDAPDSENESDADGSGEDEEEEEKPKKRDVWQPEEDDEDYEEAEEADEQDEEEEDEEQQKKDEAKSKKKQNDAEERERKRKEQLESTVFVRNLPTTVTEESLSKLFAKFGEIQYCRLVIDQMTGKPRGSAFVCFGDKINVSRVMADAYPSYGPTRGKAEGESCITMDGRSLVISQAMDRENAESMSEEKRNAGKKVRHEDKRNLRLASIGFYSADRMAEMGLEQTDIKRRQSSLQKKNMKLKNPNFFVSPTRLSLHYLPPSLTQGQLRNICREAGRIEGDKTPAVVRQCKIVREKVEAEADAGAEEGQQHRRRKDKPEGRSKGYAFVEFAEHRNALAALEKLNNNGELFEGRKPMVEFAVENAAAINKLKRSMELGKAALERKRKQAEALARKEKEAAAAAAKPPTKRQRVEQKKKQTLEMERRQQQQEKLAKKRERKSMRQTKGEAKAAYKTMVDQLKKDLQ
eukprot:m51a1_g8995 putative RNA-binding family protein (861) ;mRNA; f:94501-98105